MRPLQEDAETTRQPPRTPAHGAPAAGALQLPVLRARLLQPRAVAPPRADHAHGAQGRVGKNPGFFLPVFLGLVLVVLGFFVFFYICPDERVFRVFSVSRILLGASRR